MELRTSRDWPRLEQVYAAGLQQASQLGNVAAQLSYLTAIGNTRLLRLRFGDAIQSYLQAKTLAVQSRDWASVGPISLNLAAIYERLWDYSSAIAAAEEGRAALERLGPANVIYRTELLLQLGRLYAHAQDPRATATLLQAVESAKRRRDWKLEAASCGMAGEWLLETGDLGRAEGLLFQAFALRTKHSASDLPYSYMQLGHLRLRQAQGSRDPQRTSYLKQADSFTAKASEGMPESATRGFDPLMQVIRQQRGEIQENLGHTAEAFAEYRMAIHQLVRFRGGLPAANSTLFNSNVESDRIYDSFVESAVQRYFETGDDAILRESFLASEVNRAVSLRETRALAGVWRTRLPDSYWALLADLRTEESRMLSARPDPKFALTRSRIKLRLTEMEAEAGRGLSPRNNENFRSRTSLIDFHKGLRNSELLLSF